MKLSFGTIVTAVSICNVQAFAPQQQQQTTSSLSMTKPNDENKSNTTPTRRQAFTTLLTTTAAILTTAAQPAFAKREPLPEYLTEPTEAFKESERQRDEFPRNQLIVKRKFNTVLDRLTFESKTQEEIIADLKELRYLVIETEGLPLGIKKDEMVKIIRAKKAKGFWPTEVEYAYQKLTAEIAYQQSPNREKDVANPL